MSDLSERAQKIRKQVLKTPEERASEKADEVFNWILSYFEKRLNIVLSENSLTFDYSRDRISIGSEWCHDDGGDDDYDYEEISLKPVTSKISLDDFLNILKERIESEKGFKCKLGDTDDSEAKKITVTIE